MEARREETVLDLPVSIGTFACKLSFTDTAGESEMHFPLNIYFAFVCFAWMPSSAAARVLCDT